MTVPPIIILLWLFIPLVTFVIGLFLIIFKKNKKGWLLIFLAIIIMILFFVLKPTIFIPTGLAPEIPKLVFPAL